MKWILIGATVAYKLWRIWEESQKEDTDKDMDNSDSDEDVIE